MANTVKDLWGELNLENVALTPLSSLKEQATLLGDKTNNLIRGEVISRTFSPSESKEERVIHVKARRRQVSP